MKKCLSILLALTIAVLCACSESATGNYTVISFEDTNVHDNPKVEANYFFPETSYRYFNVEDLTEQADLVIIGRVTNISFAVLDATTGFPPTEKTSEDLRWLNTIYDIDVITSYKGEPPKSVQMKVDGGIRDERVEEQLALIKEMNAWPPEGIPVEEKMPEMKIGGIYLFTLSQGNSELFLNMAPQQTVFNLNDPFRKQGVYEMKNPADYYSRSIGPYESDIISVYDIISAFGEDKWDEFWADWQRDNPDWDTWMDKAAVEKVLAES